MTLLRLLMEMASCVVGGVVVFKRLIPVAFTQELGMLSTTMKSWMPLYRDSLPHIRISPPVEMASKKIDRSARIKLTVYSYSIGSRAS